MSKNDGRRRTLLSAIFVILAFRSSSPHAGIINLLTDNVTHKKIPFDVTRENVVEFGFSNKKKRLRYQFYLTFAPRIPSDENMRAMNEMIGAFTVGNANDNFRSGITIPLSLTVSSVLTDGRQTVIYDKTIDRLLPGYHGGNETARVIDQVWLDPGEYSVRLVLSEALPALKELNVFFEIGIPATF